MAEYFFGIDFGACNLKCVQAAEKKVRAIQLNTNESGDYHTPNAIFYKKLQSGDIENVIGQTALNMGGTEPKNLIIGLKRKLEQKNWRSFIPNVNREISALEAVEDIFQKIYAFATKRFQPGDIARACVTVPVIFTKHQRKLIRESAEKAGFKVEAIVNEAFAAIFAIETEDDSLNVIFDCGGSTLDISIIKISGNEIQELAAAGIKLGGLDIDKDILEKILIPKYADKLNARWQNENAEDFKLNFARRLKENLYSDDFNETADASIVDASFDFQLNRADIDKIFETEHYGERIIKLLDEIFDDLSQGEDCFDKSDVTKVYAVGGSLHIPYFRNLLENYFGAELFDSQDYEFEDNAELIEGLDDKYLIVAGGAAEFLKRRSEISATNAIPYRICYKVGKNLKLGISKNSPAGYETLYLEIKFAELEKANWKIEIYQTFSDEIKFEESAYIAEVKLNSALYEKKNKIAFLKMKMMRDGRLRLRFLERRELEEGADIILVEQHFLNLED